MDRATRRIEPGGCVGGGQLKLLSRLGEGGFGQVFLAETGQGLKAVKVVDTSVWSGDEYEVFNAMLMAEASFLGTLEHPVLPRFSNLLAEDACYYLIMEWVRGQNLQEHVGLHGPLDMEETFHLLGALIRVLHYFHRECEGGVVFGDLKPANVLRAGPEEFRLVDLGLASKKGHRMGGRFSIFSPNFTAPERIVGALSDPAQDLYSLGATVLFAVSGEEPHRGWSARAAQEAVRRWFRRAGHYWGEASLHCFKKLMTLLLACVDPEPGGRPSGIRVLAQAWSRVEAVREEETREASAPSADQIMRLLYREKR